jgi:hypothetical protein
MVVVRKESEARSDIYTGSESRDDYPFRPVTFFPTTIVLLKKLNDTYYRSYLHFKIK